MMTMNTPLETVLLAEKSAVSTMVQSTTKLTSRRRKTLAFDSGGGDPVASGMPEQGKEPPAALSRKSTA
jgi:hypothetical protein